MIRRGVRRLLALFRRDRLDRDFADEMSSHLDMAAADLEREGHGPAEARRLARIRMGGWQENMEHHRDTRGVPWIDSAAADIRYALRGIRRAPGFAAITVAIIAIGIGANTAVFSVVSPLLLRPLPFADPHRLVWIEKAAPEGNLSSRTFQVAMLESLARENRSFESLTAYFPFYTYSNYTLTGRGDAEKLNAVDVAPNFFSTLGVRPLLGRAFRAEDGQTNAAPVAMLSYAYWQRRFASDPSIVGQTLALNGESYTVTGVLGPDFDFNSIFMPAATSELYVPARFDRMRRWGNVFFFIGRLKPDVTLGQARAEIATLAPRIYQADRGIFPGEYPIRLETLSERVSGSLRRPLAVLWAAVGVVLLVVCANLASLMLARTNARLSELSVRAALGAGRLRIARQLVTEGLVLAAAGALLGVPLAYAVTRYLQQASALSIPLRHLMEVGPSSMLFAGLLVVILGSVAGLAPVFRLPSASRGLSARSSTASPGQRWARSSLVVAEVALAFVLVTGAGLLLRSFVRLIHVDLGFDPAQTAAVSLDVPRESNCGTPRDCFVRRKGKAEEAVRRAAAIPGVETAALTDALPLGRNRSWFLSPLGRQYPQGQAPPSAFVYLVSPGFFKAMGIPLVAGRWFDDRDAQHERGEVPLVINQSAAKTLWPGQQAVGQLASRGEQDPYRIVGIVADTKQSSLDTTSGFQMYLPMSPRFGGYDSSNLVVRSTLPAPVLSAGVRAALREFDPALAATNFRPLQDLVDVSVSPRRFLVSLISGFGIIALILAALGIYGVVSFSVAQRYKETGIRLALGASPAAVRRHVVSGSAALVSVGILIGVAAALAAGPFLVPVLHQTSPRDPFAYAATGAVLLLVAVMAAMIPARRASRVDPAITLRSE